MRKVRIAALQPGYMDVPEPYNFHYDNYINKSDEIMDKYVIKQLDITIALLDKAGRQGCDIITTSEDISGLGQYLVDITDNNIFPELVKLSYPLVENRLSQVAKKHSMYVIGCYYKQVDGKTYNVASIFDRYGDICGEYRKTHIPPDERWQCEEGDSIDIFELDFGTIGISICYDIMFQEHMRALSLKGAEIVFHPTLGYGWYDDIGEATLRVRANDNSVYIATAKNYQFNKAGKSSIIDHWGHILVDAAFDKDVYVFKEIDLDNRKMHPEWYYSTQTSGIGEVYDRMLLERRPELYSIISTDIHGKIKLPDKASKLEVFNNIKIGKCHW